MKNTSPRKFLVLFFILGIIVFLGITKGAVDIPLYELLKENRQILYLRILRILLSVLVGSGLAVSGIALQAILRNPLAEPYLLGTSSGAGVGAVAAIMLGISQIYLPISAFLGATASIVLVYTISKQGNRIPVQSLVLSGAIVSIALSAISVFMVSLSPDEAVHGLMWWLWGSLEIYDLKLLPIVSVIVIAGITTIFIFSQDLNAMSIGEEEAIHLGIRTETVKKILFVVTSLMTASLVCVAGIIGFVGLIVPHMVRLIVGPDHRILIPSSCVVAAIFMILCDTISRSVFSPSEIPIGVITAVIGAPVFIVLLKTRQRFK